MSVTYRHPVTGEEITFASENRILERKWERVEDKPPRGFAEGGLVEPPPPVDDEAADE